MYDNYEDDYFEREYATNPLIHELIMYGSYDVIDKLVRERSINLECVNDEGQTPFEVAVNLEGDNDKIIILLARRMASRYKKAEANNRLLISDLREKVKKAKYSVKIAKSAIMENTDAATRMLRNMKNVNTETLSDGRKHLVLDGCVVGSICTLLLLWGINCL